METRAINVMNIPLVKENLNDKSDAANTHLEQYQPRYIVSAIGSLNRQWKYYVPPDGFLTVNAILLNDFGRLS
jgi:hypothetical protein